MIIDCQTEQDLIDAIAAGRWPDRADAALREHVSACPICADVAAVAGLLFDDRDAAWAETQVPPASLVWWRAQVRAREQAARVALRPIALAHAASIVGVAALLLVLFPPASASVRDAVDALMAADWWSLPAVTLSRLSSAAAGVTLPLLAIAIWVVVAPVVIVYLAIQD